MPDIYQDCEKYLLQLASLRTSDIYFNEKYLYYPYNVVYMWGFLDPI